MLHRVFLVGGSRTPVGSFLGTLKDFSAIDLAVASTKSALEKTGINPKSIDHVILGNVIATGLGQNPARQIALNSNIKKGASCVNINKLCASGLKSVILGTQALTLNQGSVALVGGFESMSNLPFLLKNYRKGHKFGHLKILDTLTFDGLEDANEKKVMGFFAEHTARELGICREEQDAYCLESYKRALDAQKRGVFAQQICQMFGKKGLVVDKDEEPGNFKPEKVGKLKAVFVEK